MDFEARISSGITVTGPRDALSARCPL